MDLERPWGSVGSGKISQFPAFSPAVNAIAGGALGFLVQRDHPDGGHGRFFDLVLTGLIAAPAAPDEPALGFNDFLEFPIVRNAARVLPLKLQWLVVQRRR